MSEKTNLLDFLANQLADADTAWSLGTFGAIAEFTRDADEAAAISRADDMISAVTARGGLRIEACRDVRPIASKSLTSESWSHRVALCLPEQACAMSRRTVLTEVGPDQDALRAEDRAAILFDLGLGALQVDVCVRSSDAGVVAELRNCVGKSLFAPGNGAMRLILASNPHRVFVSRVGRIEVFQPIPPPDGKSPEGPHSHVLPKLLRSGRTHAATEPLPAGWIPCAHCYPPNPVRDRFGHRQTVPGGAPRGFPSTVGSLRRTAIRRHQAARHRIRGGWSRAVCSLASGRQVHPSHRARRLAAVEGAGPDVASAG